MAILLFSDTTTTRFGYASDEDVAVRLRREFDDAETDQVNALLGAATDLLLDAIERTEEWAEEREIPGVLRTICIEAVVRVIQNPAGLKALQETLGAASSSESFTDASTGLELTPAEERRARRAVYGSGTGSSQLGSVLDDPLVAERYGTAAFDPPLEPC